MAAPQPFQHPPQSNRRIITSVHVLVMVMSFIGMGFVFFLLGVEPYYTPALSAGPVFAVAFFWSLVELIVRRKRGWKADIHPGAHVVVCLVLWLSAVGVGAQLATFAA
ncbi:hypothetical protein MGU_08602 [Metarhizium guizhouense ARSEF 977]|uniref:Uncharacterized protein n=1 Tax=Metarhizium guizhouense (strain ARSEF 977) TaxID=1276136 RepID=A0A0B4GNN8_METGA|nr:hypothetical protein MGU_08602 [Metarhizium guizhouense ARSEF 977]